MSGLSSMDWRRTLFNPMAEDANHILISGTKSKTCMQLAVLAACFFCLLAFLTALRCHCVRWSIDDAGSAWCIHRERMGPVVMRAVGGEVLCSVMDPAESTEQSSVWVQGHLINPRSPTANTVVEIAVVTMEIEHKYQISLFKHNHLVLLVFPRNVLVIIGHKLQLHSQFHQKFFVALMTWLKY